MTSLAQSSLHNEVDEISARLMKFYGEKTGRLNFRKT